MGRVGCDLSVARLEDRGAWIKKNEQGEVVDARFIENRATDADLVHLKELTKRKSLNRNKTQITDAGVAELEKVLPNCKITK